MRKNIHILIILCFSMALHTVHAQSVLHILGTTNVMVKQSPAAERKKPLGSLVALLL